MNLVFGSPLRPEAGNLERCFGVQKCWNFAIAKFHFLQRLWSNRILECINVVASKLLQRATRHLMQRLQSDRKNINNKLLWN